MGVTSASGSLFGLAYGDALGKPTELLSVDQMQARMAARYGRGGPCDVPTWDREPRARAVLPDRPLADAR